MERVIFIGNRPLFAKLIPQDSNFHFEFFENSRAFNRHNINRRNIRSIIICESGEGSITTNLIENIFLIRYYDYNQPVKILSFLSFDQLKTLQPSLLSHFNEDESHEFIRLPIDNTELIERINSGKSSPYPRDLKFINQPSGKMLIEHALGEEATIQQTKHNQSLQTNGKPAVTEMKRVMNILLVDNDVDVIMETSMQLEAYKEKHTELEYDIQLIARQDSESVKDLILDTQLNIQCVLIDWWLRHSDVDSESSLTQGELLEQIQSLRPELPIHIFSQSKNGIYILNSLKNTNQVGFFTKDQLRNAPASVFNKIINQFNERNKAPFWNAYKEYVVDSKDTWHTPGHARGRSFRRSRVTSEFYNFFGGNMFAADLSVSAEGLGSLLESTRYIKEAQYKAAKSFGSKLVYFSTNGSSTTNKVILQTLLRPGDGIIVDRNCHKSVHYGIIQAGAMPYYLDSEYNEDYGIFAPPALDTVKRTIAEAQKNSKEAGVNLKAIVLTGCTYDGILMDIGELVKIGHKAGLKVFIDEAWFAYSGFHPFYRKYSAIYSKADYVTHSAHKVLSSLSQASYMHINDPDFDEDYFREIYYIYTSTSPQYHIIASLDVAATQMEVDGFKIIDETLQLADYFRKGIKSLKRIKLVVADDFHKVFKHLKKNNVGFDPLKILLDVRNLPYNLEDIHQFLRQEGGLEIEKTTKTTILVLMTIGSGHDNVYRLYAALKALDDGNVRLLEDTSKKVDSLAAKVLKKDLSVKLQGLPSNAFFFSERELVPLKNLIERKEEDLVSINLVTPYPPGIPYLIPNQLITKEIVEELLTLKQAGVEIHGCHESKIWVANSKKVNQ